MHFSSAEKFISFGRYGSIFFSFVCYGGVFVFNEKKSQQECVLLHILAEICINRISEKFLFSPADG